MPELTPGRKPAARTPRPGRPAVIDRDRIVAAALELDQDTLTMQAVARRLGVATSALYRWVGGRAELLDLASAELSRRIVPRREPTEADWRDWLAELAHRIRREFRAVPGFAARALTGGHRAVGHDIVERGVVTAFTLGGLPPEHARQRWYVFATAVLGWLAAEESGRFPADPPMDFDTLVEVLLGSVQAEDG
ncbi:TetR/AcrR family transcriptional regulator C-terminal domain-containing protein [Streptomyces sp. CT34]|uniref:TetR/AcrR family transcriptional regulator n=1 Tax=Streptomyces sp. CT34 TaxID=1553907 RepID=UPI0007C812FA|nr:TetR/AcrR family transcriptional regulator C-terminal domain-containing protein [Streptomyces sp. CT34]